ncbi:MAG: alpha/beta hydrolase [Ectothiorhodospiraceae bacterium]
MPEDTFRTHDGLQLTVQRLGSGPPLVVLPGWLGAASDWSPVVQRLSDQCSATILEPRPHVASQQPTVTAMADDLHALLAAFELEQPLVLGHSMGTSVCWEYVARYGCDALGGLCLVEQSPRLITDSDWTLGLGAAFTPEANRAFTDWLARDFPAAALDLMDRGRGAPAGSAAARLAALFADSRRRRVAALRPDPWIRAWESFAWQDYREVLPRITVPTLLIYGARSFYGRAVGEYVRDRIPGARLEVLEAAGHAPQQDDLAGFVAVLRGFVAERHEAWQTTGEH